MKVTDVVEKEKIDVFHKAAYEIIQEHLEEDVVFGAGNALLKRDSPVHIFCDGYHRGMAVAMALIDAGIIDIQTLEIQRKKEG